jgi:ethanolamine ammonia-lyase small subunit
MSDSSPVQRDPWGTLRAFTRARIGLERCGDGIPTRELLQFELDHAHARDAVNCAADFAALTAQLGSARRILQVHSAAPDRSTYIRRPDLGRRLDERSRALLDAEPSVEQTEVTFIIADGLSSAAVNAHAAATLDACLRRLFGWRVGPIVLAEQARVALGDEISVLLHSDACVVLIGERPGLSVTNSLGIYLTWQPTVGHRDADRNCVSNIHADGLSYEDAADKACWLLQEARRLQLSGTALKENAVRSSTARLIDASLPPTLMTAR